jgi:phage-related holin
MMNYLEKICDLNKVWAYLACSLLTFLEPVGVLVLWLFIFVFVDLATGIIASLKEGKYMTSSGLRKTAEKFFYYFLSIFLVEGMDKYMIGWGEMTKIFSCLLCGVEFYSILENFYRITGHRSFKILTQFTIKKIEEHTGVKIDEK